MAECVSPCATPSQEPTTHDKDEMKKTWTILAALALGAGTQTAFAAALPPDALRPAEGGIFVAGGGETSTESDFERVLNFPRNTGASHSNRTALVKDGQGTLVIDQDTTINPSFAEREGTMSIEGASLTTTTPLQSPSLTVDGTHAHWVPDGGSYKPDAATAAAVYGAADLLNTLWTSTGMVQDFARKAVMTQAWSRSFSPQEDLRDYFGRGIGVSLWGSGLGYFSNRGGAHGFDFNSGGYAVGCDAELMRDRDWNVRAGLAFGQGFGTFKSDAGSKVDQDALMFALYGGVDRRLHDDMWLCIGGYVACGRVDNEGRTLFIDGSPGDADWNDDVWSFGLQTELNYRVSDYFMVTPFTGLDYVYGSHGSLAEYFGDGLNRRYSHGAMQVWRVPVGVRFSMMMALWDNNGVIPELSVAYVGDISRSNPHATVEGAGSRSRVNGSNPGRSALMLRAGATFMLGARWSTGAAYHLEVRSGQTAQGVNAYVRYQF